MCASVFTFKIQTPVTRVPMQVQDPEVSDSDVPSCLLSFQHNLIAANMGVYKYIAQ